MSVSRRHKLAGIASSTFVLSAIIGMAGLSVGQAQSPNSTHVPQMGHGGHAPSHKGCCKQTKNHTIGVPGVHIGTPSVHVATPHISVHQGEFSIHQSGSFKSTFTETRTNDQEIIYGGGGYYGGGSSYVASNINKLNVEGGEFYTEEITEKVPIHKEVCIDRIVHEEISRPVRAVCIDATGTPHPASQVERDDMISQTYDGEVFRCMAGTTMQVTLGSLQEGSVSFAEGQSFSCQKGEALVHRPGGKLECAPQAPRRNCNERSLLRKYGPGIKLITSKEARTVCEPTTKTVYETRVREVVREKPVAAGSIVFDGGVGQGFN